MKTPIEIDWSQNVLDFYNFGEILDLFRGGNLLSVSTVYGEFMPLARSLEKSGEGASIREGVFNRHFTVPAPSNCARLLHDTFLKCRQTVKLRHTQKRQ